MALLDMQCKITDSIDNNKFSLGIFFDLSKAFDTVDHKILLKKLEHYGIRGVVLNWFSDYLTNRSQCVCFNGSLSGSKRITCGVPQGSILGPLLFLIYVNDLSKTSRILHFVLFADDTNVFISDKSLESLFKRANCELKLISSWFKANRLSLNIEKTNFIIFRSHRKSLGLTPHDFRIAMDGKSICQVSSCKFLGVYIDQHLTWMDHINHISRKIAKNISILSRVRHCLPRTSLIGLYYALIFPYLSYCIISWGSNYHCRLNALEILQKRAIRVIFGLRWSSSTKPTFLKQKILQLCDITKLQIGLFMFRYHHRMLPPNFNGFFSLGSDIHGHDTRSSNSYRCASARLNLKQFCIKCTGPPVWNSLPEDIRTAVSIKHFKNKLKYFLYLCKL
jgi:hypothetical protein